MDSVKLTHERLRTALNSDQASRERLCLSVLSLDRNYTDVKPRRPEGGPDGGRDIECLRNGQPCFGAVGFQNNVSDAPQEIRSAKKKFKDDLKSALKAKPDIHAFVFFTNVDLIPGEVKQLVEWGEKKGVSFIDIYYRERICLALSNPEGLAFRYQYLSIKLSDEEQASFFSRFGSDIERLVRGGFDSIERKIDELAFENWKNGYLKNLKLKLYLRDNEEGIGVKNEHFRVLLLLECVGSQDRNIFLGGRDDYWTVKDGKWIFGTRSFFSRKLHPQSDSGWIKPSGRGGSPIISEINFGFFFFSPYFVPIAEFQGLKPWLHITKNLIPRISSIELTSDSYLLMKCDLDSASWVQGRHKDGSYWPDELTEDEKKEPWMYLENIPWRLNLDKPVLKEVDQWN